MKNERAVQSLYNPMSNISTNIEIEPLFQSYSEESPDLRVQNRQCSDFTTRSLAIGTDDYQSSLNVANLDKEPINDGKNGK